jgi:tetratricopeptide (TPR) repeat protein
VRLGRYEILEEIGRGGAGRVFRAREEGTGTLRAVKLLEHADPGSVARFERERRLLLGLGEAEGFVPLLDAGSSAEGPWIAMPLVTGGTLRDRLRRGRLSADETLALLRPVARALATAHERGVVHRDLKPENIIFTETGEPLVADLGLAKDLGGTRHDGGSLSRTGDFRGTPGYAPPEQLLDSKSAGPSVDVFALGAIGFECLTGGPVFTGETALALVQNVLDGKRQRSSLLRGEPRWLVRVLDRALERDPARRFRDGAALALALEGKTERRTPWLAGAVAAAVVGGAVLALSTRAKPGGDDLASALARESAGDDAGALEALGRVLALEPENATAWARRALLRARSRDGKGALSDAERALSLAPSSAVAWCARGVARDATGDLEGALTDLGRAIDLDGSLVEARVARARARTERNDARGALADAENAIAFAPTLARAWVARAAARALLRDWPRARDDAERALSLEPASALALALRGAARASLGEADGRKDGDRALALAPGDAGIRLLRARMDELDDDDGSVLTDCDRAIDLDARLLEAWIVRARARSRRGDHTGALADATEAVTLAPNDARSFVARGRAKLAAGSVADALQDLDRAVELDGSDPDSLVARGEALLAKRDFPHALEDFHKALEHDERNTAAWLGCARVHELEGDPPDAAREAGRAVESARDVRERREASVQRDRLQRR